MLVETARVSAAWQPAAPQVSGATRRSPGFTNLMYSAGSLSHFVKVRSGTFERLRKLASRGWMCAFSLAELYSGEFGAMLDAAGTEALPPWQSVQPRGTVFVGCIVGSSVELWQEMHPEDLRSASSCDCPRNGSDACGACAGGSELA